MDIYVYGGKMASGKDHAASIKMSELLEQGKYIVRINFATELKRILNKYFLVKKESIPSVQYYAYRNGPESIDRLINDIPDFKVVKYYYWNKLLSVINEYHTSDEHCARRCMQYFGTDIVRDQISQSYWVDHLTNKINTLPEDAAVIVSDYRFPNEHLTPSRFNSPSSTSITHIKVVTEDSIRIARGSYSKHNDNHRSELSVDLLEFDCEVSGN